MQDETSFGGRTERERESRAPGRRELRCASSPRAPTFHLAAGRHLGRKAPESRARRTLGLTRARGRARGGRSGDACPFKGPVSGHCRPRRRDVPGPPRPATARFLPGGATAPEVLRRRRPLGAGGSGCTAGAAASFWYPSPAAQGKGERAAPGPGSGRGDRGEGRVAPAAGSQTDGRAASGGGGVRPWGRDTACRRPRRVGLGRRVAAAGLLLGPGHRGWRAPSGLAASPGRRGPDPCSAAASRPRTSPEGEVGRRGPGGDRDTYF